MFYSKALLHATYINGNPAKRTDEHEKAEHHRFKTDYLFKKNAPIPKDLYVARLIQHFVIIQAIESQLQNMSEEGKAEINAFFALAYLEQLWRIPGIQKDLEQLDVNIHAIHDAQITPATNKYLTDIEQLSPKRLLGHFLLHVAGFMHGGNIIQAKYIKPSNHLTTYQISAEQYNFSDAAALLNITHRASLSVYDDMMNQVDAIELNEEEYDDLLQQGKSVYETMANIYDDLCDMHTNQPKLNYYPLAVVCVSMLAIAYILNLLSAYSNPINPAMSSGPN
jgi:heme oxygenase